jgi:hypothetical protein
MGRGEVVDSTLKSRCPSVFPSGLRYPPCRDPSWDLIIIQRAREGNRQLPSARTIILLFTAHLLNVCVNQDLADWRS